MAISNEIGAALKRVHKIAQTHGGNILLSREIGRKDREILIRGGWLQLIIKGWYLLVRPDTRSGDSTVWYTNFWDFIRIYLGHHYGKEYCLSAENSIDIHVKSTVLPKQIIVIISKTGGAPLQLPFETSLLVYGDSKNIPEEKIDHHGLQIMELSYALCRVAPTFFLKDPQNAEIALGLIRSPDELVSVMVKHQFKAAANRLVGAYNFMGNKEFSKILRQELTSFGFHIREENPFKDYKPLIDIRIQSPYKARIRSLWSSYRETIIKHFPSETGIPKNITEYLENMDDIYKQDAYNSLSIEGYRVDQELIERVLNNDWNPESNPKDEQMKDALAARGYYEAFLEVKKTIVKIFDGANPGEVFQSDLQGWFRKLFGTSVIAGLIKETDLIGYRRWQVYIRNSRHTPLPRDALLDAMEALFTCLKEETNPAVQAILGHYIFVFIHPYMDGNGRIARFLMNTMFASGGCPWTIIHVKNRQEYFDALETVHVKNDIEPFVLFIKKEMKSIKPDLSS